MSLVLAGLQAEELVRSAAPPRWTVFGDYSLGDPLVVALLPVALALFLYGRSRRGRASGRVSVLPTGRLPRSWRQRTAFLPGLAQLLALLLCVGALARPLRGSVESSSVSEGVDIALVVDRSSSMKFEDLEAGHSRLEVVVDVVGEFAERRMTDREGAADNVGLFVFAHFPTFLCPFTLDVDALRGFLDAVEIVERREEDGTGIGNALAKAVSVLRESEASSKVVVLLTDGENNQNEIAPLEAADLAAAEGIRVHTVFAGRFVYQQDFLGRIFPTDEELDTSELEEIAERTGGRFFHARDRRGLEQVYGEIEAMERTAREERRYVETFDLYPFLLRPALLLYLLSWIGAATLWEEAAVSALLAIALPQDAPAGPGSTGLGFELLRPDWLALLLLSGLLALVGWYGLSRRRAERAQLVSASRLASFLPEHSAPRAAARLWLAVGAALLLVLAAVGPVRGYTLREVHRRGLDIVVCIDTSRSMLARDLRPDRLRRAVREVGGLLESLRGDRVALIAFSGEAREVAPLTHDRVALRGLLEAITPEDNRMGGTDLATALERALDLFDGRTGAHEAIVLLTDGEDLEGRAAEQAAIASRRGIRVYVVGVGTAAGGKIPVLDERGGESFLRGPEGAEVVSRLGGESLAALAELTGGAYLSTEQSPTPLETLYDSAMSRLERRELEGGLERVPHDRFQWPLALALLCMLVEVGLRERSPRRGAGSRGGVAAGEKTR